MENNNEKNGFSYTYSAKDRAEIKRIREKYTHPKKEESTLERLRRLDASVTQRAQAASLICGVLGALILGFGLSLALSPVFATMLGLGQLTAILLGSLTGILGCIPTALAYPVYLRVLAAERKRVAPEILRLTDDLMK